MSNITITKGTILYRLVKGNYEIIMRKCMITGKRGSYLTPSLASALKTADEKKNLTKRFYIHTYEVTRDMVFMVGKNSFKEINSFRYFDNDGYVICNVDVLEEENISHVDLSSPIIERVKHDFIEIFITKDYEINSLKHISTSRVFADDVRNLFILYSKSKNKEVFENYIIKHKI